MFWSTQEDHSDPVLPEAPAPSSSVPEAHNTGMRPSPAPSAPKPGSPLLEELPRNRPPRRSRPRFSPNRQAPEPLRPPSAERLPTNRQSPEHRDKPHGLTRTPNAPHHPAPPGIAKTPDRRASRLKAWPPEAALSSPTGRNCGLRHRPTTGCSDAPPGPSVCSEPPAVPPAPPVAPHSSDPLPIPPRHRIAQSPQGKEASPVPSDKSPERSG